MDELLGFLAFFWLLMSVVLWLWQAWRYTRMNTILSETYDSSESSYELPDLSLIIACRNEAENIERHLAFWLDQKGVQFEMVFVDDHSTDNTFEVAQAAAAKYDQVSCVRLDDPQEKGKKWAIERGIQKAKNEHLVFCDADCKPASNQWLRAVAKAFSMGNDMVLGYGKMIGPSSIQALVDFETSKTAMQFWHYAKVKNPYMGVGRNLAYTKSLYYNNPEHKKHRDLLSGDDDLFVNSAGQSAKIEILTSPETFTLSAAPSSFAVWWRQKLRHYSASWRYRLEHKLSLGFEGILILLFWLLMPIGFYYLPLESLVLVATRFFLSFFPSRMQSGLFYRPMLQSFWPIWELIWILSTFILQIRILLLGAVKKW